MDRSIRGEPAESNALELLKPPRQRGVIRNREIQLEQLDQRQEEALGLAKRKMEDHAKRQRGLDREVRIGALATGFATGRGTPSTKRCIREPDRNVATLLGPCLVIRPNSKPDIETSRTCIGCVSDTSSVRTPGSMASRHLEATIGSHAPTPL
jgi:hypothetical protein